MAVEYKAGGNRLSRGIRKVLSFLIRIIVAYLVLLLVAGILTLFDINAPYDILMRIADLLEYGLLMISEFL